MSQIAAIAARMKMESPVMAATPADQRNDALARIKEALLAHAADIFAANEADLAAAARDGVAPAVVKRLRFDRHKLDDVCAGIDQTIALPDPVGHVLLRRELDEGLVLERVSVPIGVIGVIFEARPDALVQISTLCLKSGNCAILKGGKETAQTNRVLFSIIRDAADRHGIALAAVVGTSRNPKAVAAREEAVRGIAEANPALSQEAIGKLFGIGRETVAGMIRRGA